MPFLLLLVLTLTCLQRRWPAPAEWLGPGGSIFLTWGVMALLGLVAWLATRRWDRRLQLDSSSRSLVVRRYWTFRRWHACLLIAAYFWLVCFGGWGWFVSEGCLRGEVVVPGTDLVLLSPLFAGLVLSWASYHSLERALAVAGLHSSSDEFPGRWAYVGLQARQSFLLAAPPLILMFLQQVVIALWPELLHSQRLLPLLCMALLVGMYISVPLLLRLLLGLKPLPDGPLRERLLSAARRLSFRFSDIVVWNTRGAVVNAMVTGALPNLRYVILTDRLIEELDPDEIEAVFGHEVGHIKHHHLYFYFAFLLASLVTVIGLWNLFVRFLHSIEAPIWLEENLPVLHGWIDSYEILAALPLFVMLGVYIVLIFGFLSRRCERQADIFGCRAVTVPAFISALEKVARCNGISRDRPGWLQSWQHATIAQRVAFLEKMQTDPEVEPRFQRRVGLVKWVMLGGLAGILSLLVLVLGVTDMLAILSN